MFTDIDDPELLSKLANRKEFVIHRFADELDNSFHLTPFQSVAKNFLNPYSPYKSLLLFWATGTGKTIASLFIAESYQPLIRDLNKTGVDCYIYIIVKNNQTMIQFIETLIMYEVSQDKYVFEHERAEYYRLKDAYMNKPSVSNYKAYESKYRIFFRRIRDFAFYKIITYPKFRNSLNGTNATERITDASNSLLIFDEAHELERNTADELLTLLKRQSVNMKVLLVTATPMSTYPYEIINVLNFLRETPLIQNDYFETNEDGSVILRKGAELEIGRLSRGYVSYYMIAEDSKFYPKKIVRGKLLHGFKQLKIVACKMSTFHTKTFYDTVKGYNVRDVVDFSVSEGDERRLSDIESAMDIVLPTPSSDTLGIPYARASTLELAPRKWLTKYGIEIHDGDVSGSIFHVDNIQRYSSKYHQMILNIINALTDGNKNMLVFHRRITNGLTMIEKVLIANGIIHYDIRHSTYDNTRCSVCGLRRDKHTGSESHDFSPACYVMFEGRTDDTARTKYKNIFNSRANKHGAEIKIILGSIVLREGWDFKRIRQVHIMQYQNSLNMEKQVIGRAVRYKSHIDLKPINRTVEVFRYISTLSDKPETSNEWLQYMNQERRFLNIHTIEHELIKNAINVELTIDETEKPLAIDASKIDTTGFDAYYYRDEMNIYRTLIIQLFSVFILWTADELFDKVSTMIETLALSPFQNRNYLALTIFEMVQSKDSFIVNGVNGYIIRRGKYYLFNPYNLSEMASVDERTLSVSIGNTNNVADVELDMSTFLSIELSDIISVPIGKIISTITTSDDFDESVISLTVDNKYKLIRYVIEQQYASDPLLTQAQATKIAKIFKPVMITRARLLRNSYRIAASDKSKRFNGYIDKDTSRCYDGTEWSLCHETYKSKKITTVTVNKIYGVIYVKTSNTVPVFKLIINKQDRVYPYVPKNADGRRRSRGHACVTLNQKVIKKIMAELGVKFNKTKNVSNWCKRIRDRLMDLDAKRTSKKRYFFDYLEFEQLKLQGILNV